MIQMGFKELKQVKTSCNESAENFKGEWTKTCNSLFVYIYFFYILTFEYYILCCTRGAGYSVLLSFFSFFLFVCFWNPEAANERCCSEVVVAKF